MKFFFLNIFILFSVTQGQWNNIPQLYSRDIYTIYFDDPNIYASSDSLFFISRDNGITWDSLAIVNKLTSYNDIIKIDGTIYVTAYGQGVYRSSDNGISWEPMNSGLDYFSKYAISFQYNNNQLYLATDGGGVYYSNLNSPVTWHPYNDGLPSLYGYTINDLQLIKDGLIASAGASGYYYVRNNNSAEWTEYSVDTLKRPNIHSFVSFNDTVFAATTRGVYRSIDNGLTWDSVGISPMPYPADYLTKDGNRIYAVYIIKGEFYLWYSDDKGDTWNFKDHQFTTLYQLKFRDNKFWAATHHGIWFNAIDPTGVDNDIKPVEYKLEQNYPNPFNPTTKIKYSIPVEMLRSAEGRTTLQNVTLKIYDILGNEVATLVNKEQPASEYEVVWNASNLPSGIYFYRLTVSGKHIKTMKMILMK